MILNNNVVPHVELNFRGAKEFVLLDTINFCAGELLPGREDVNSSYLVYDTKRKDFIRSCAAAMGVNKRWEEHHAASLLKHYTERTNKFYCDYPATQCDVVNHEIMSNNR